jgi:hypothetical protein
MEIPSNQQVPLFVKEQFGAFYRDLFQRSWKQQGEQAVWVEYAWDLSSSNYSHCDPCTTTPPAYTDLREAGVFWLQSARPNGYSISDYAGEVFFTRLHVRYRRSTFPQDLVFLTTPNRSPFQGRYILTHPAAGDLSCPEGKDYKKQLLTRRQDELRNLSQLTGWAAQAHAAYLYSAPLQAEQRRLQPYLEPLPAPDTAGKGAAPVLPGGPDPGTPLPGLEPGSGIEVPQSPSGWWLAMFAGILAGLAFWWRRAVRFRAGGAL